MIKPFGYFYFLKTFVEASFAWFFVNKKSRFCGITSSLCSSVIPAGRLQSNMIKPFGYFYFLKTFAEASFAWFFVNKKSRFRGI